MNAPQLPAASMEMRRYPQGQLPWHYHAQAYVAVVMDGQYEEAGDSGRFRVEPGDIIVHQPFGYHTNTVDARAVTMAYFPVGPTAALNLTSVRRPDVDQVLYDLGHGAAIGQLLQHDSARISPLLEHEADQLANLLRRDPNRALSELADGSCISSRHLRRRFASTYGMSAARYRARVRARMAWTELVVTTKALGTIAHDLGFADQAHMTRAVADLTGRSPSAWRKSF